MQIFSEQLGALGKAGAAEFLEFYSQSLKSTTATHASLTEQHNLVCGAT